MRIKEYYRGKTKKTAAALGKAPPSITVRVLHKHQTFLQQKKKSFWDFPGGPVAKTPGSQCRGPKLLSHMPQLEIPYATTKTQCVRVLVAQLCLTLCDPMDCSPPGSSVHGISQARILEWVAISFSKDPVQSNK